MVWRQGQEDREMKGWGTGCRRSFVWSLTVKDRSPLPPLLSKTSLKWKGGQLLGHRKELIKTSQHLAMTGQILDGPSTPRHGLPHLPSKEISKMAHFRIFFPGGHHH